MIGVRLRLASRAPPSGHSALRGVPESGGRGRGRTRYSASLPDAHRRRRARRPTPIAFNTPPSSSVPSRPPAASHLRSQQRRRGATRVRRSRRPRSASGRSSGSALTTIRGQVAVDVGAVAGDDVAEVLLVPEREDGEVEQCATRHTEPDYLPPAHRGDSSASAALTARSAAAKPILECVPSQNGLFVEPPQRQRAMVERSI